MKPNSYKQNSTETNYKDKKERKNNSFFFWPGNCLPSSLAVPILQYLPEHYIQRERERVEQSPFGGFLFWGSLCEDRIHGKGGLGDSKKLSLENATILSGMLLVGVIHVF